MESAPIRALPFMFSVAIAALLVKSVAALAPPVELYSWQVMQFDHRNENSQNVSALARLVAFEDALPTRQTVGRHGVRRLVLRGQDRDRRAGRSCSTN